MTYRRSCDTSLPGARMTISSLLSVSRSKNDFSRLWERTVAYERRLDYGRRHLPRGGAQEAGLERFSRRLRISRALLHRPALSSEGLRRAGHEPSVAARDRPYHADPGLVCHRHAYHDHGRPHFSGYLVWRDRLRN